MKAPASSAVRWLLLAALPVLLYFLLFARFAVDIPFGDDYAVLSFVLNFTNPHVPAKAPLLFSQHNEHRIVTLRMVLLLFHQAFQRIDFVLIALLGNLGLLGIAALFSRMPAPQALARPDPLPRSWAAAAAILPPLYLIFQLQHHEILNWAMCAFTNVFVLLFSFLSLYLLIRSDAVRAFVLAIGFSILAAYTNGNGVFVFFIGFVVLLLRRKFRRLAWWAACGLIYIGFYFHGFVRNPEHPDITAILKTGLPRLVEYTLSVIGSFADFGQKGGPIPILAGLVLLAGTAVALKKGIWRKNAFLTSGLAFLLLSFAANTVTRAPMGLAMAFMPRYKLLSILMLLCVYFSVLELTRRKKTVILGFTAFAVLFSAYSFYANYRTVRDRRPVLSMNLVEWSAYKADLPYPNAAQAEVILRAASVRRVYRAPRALNILRPRFPFGGIDGGQTAELEAGKDLLFSGWALDDGGRPSVIVRAGSPAEEREPAARPDVSMFIGKAVFRSGSIPEAERAYYGFSGTDRMIWEFRVKREDLLPVERNGKIDISFFVRDEDGQETLLGTRSLRHEGGKYTRK